MGRAGLVTDAENYIRPRQQSFGPIVWLFLARIRVFIGTTTSQDYAQQPIEILSEAAKAFVRDMRAYFKASGHKANEIAAEAGWRLKQHLPRGTQLQISDVKEMFLQMQDHV